MDKRTRRQAIDRVLLTRFVGNRSKQQGGDGDFSFTYYVEFRGTRAELVEAIEAALDEEED